jgi:hypothetical protein
MLARDLVRKWNIWQIPGQAIDWILRADNSLQLWIGGQSGTGKIYEITSAAPSDDGGIINENYCTYGFNDPNQNQMMQLGEVRKTYGYLTATAEGVGIMTVTVYPETLESPYADTYTETLAMPSLDDVNQPLNAIGNRCFFEFSTNTIGDYFEIKRVVVGIQPSPNIPVSGL